MDQILLEKPAIPQFVRKLIAIYGTRMVMIVFTEARHVSLLLKQTNPVFKPSHHISFGPFQYYTPIPADLFLTVSFLHAARHGPPYVQHAQSISPFLNWERYKMWWLKFPTYLPEGFRPPLRFVHYWPGFCVDIDMYEIQQLFDMRYRCFHIVKILVVFLVWMCEHIYNPSFRL
jgi:hypothetical protein